MQYKAWINPAIPALALLLAAEAIAAESFSEYVDADGNISLPADYRHEWTFLGAWSIADKEKPGASSLHTVYTQPGVVEAYRKTGAFPDGAVLVKEVLKTATETMTTGEVSRADGIEVWFVMVKDAQNRFSGNPLWGDGWGWALFKPDDPTKTVTKDYQTECLGCHVPAQQTDWVYKQGYPLLK